MKRHLFRDPLTAAYVMRALSVRVVAAYRSRRTGAEVTTEVTYQHLTDMARGTIYPPDFWRAVYLHPASERVIERVDEKNKQAMETLGIWPRVVEVEA